ncbi:MAG: hypothetical protein FJZ01_11450 [Candidatus Sericytochromatia bacterium]|nr:hypothetical protein [Candidatus Tanganyikabacteria bacterium]
MNLIVAIAGGIWGTVALTGLFLAARGLRISRIDHGCLLGELVLAPGPRAHVLGMIIHLLNGILFGLVYMGVMVLLGLPAVTRTTPGLQLMATLLGGLLGLYHFFIQLPLVGLVAALHRRIRRGRGRGLATDAEPWAFFFGISEHATALLAHVAYGAVFGLTVASGVGAPTLVAGLATYAALVVLSLFDLGEVTGEPRTVAFLREAEQEKVER